jgi:hypothetical protein
LTLSKRKEDKMATKKLFHITSTPKGPFEHGTYVIPETDHGYVYAKDKETALELLGVDQEDRDFHVELVRRCKGNQEKMTSKRELLQAERKELYRSIAAIENWLMGY